MRFSSERTFSFISQDLLWEDSTYKSTAYFGARLMPNAQNCFKWLIIKDNSERPAVSWNKMLEDFFIKLLSLFLKSVKTFLPFIHSVDFELKPCI
jgi:hypothetical protein